MEFIAVIIWLVLSIIVANDAAKRDMTPFWWGLATFLFGVIGAVIYLIARKPKIEK